METPLKRHPLRTLRTAASAACLVACMAFLALWGRSFFWNDTIYQHRATGYSHLRSWKGQNEFIFLPWSNPTHTLSSGLSSDPTDEWQSVVDKAGGLGIKGREPFGFGWGGMRPDETRAVAPHWFFVLVTGASSLALKPKPRLRFSLQDLLILTTLAAVVLGAVCSLHRWVS